VSIGCAGTPLGDPIEVGALGQALSSKQGPGRSIVLGSVKSVYGHTEGAAGLTGALLAYSQLADLCQPPVMHLRTLNPYVEAAFQVIALLPSIPASFKLPRLWKRCTVEVRSAGGRKPRVKLPLKGFSLSTLHTSPVEQVGTYRKRHGYRP
jgi:hypothetical protein